MKNSFKYCVLIVLSFSFLGIFFSCHKPEYNPERKISKIYADLTTITNGEITYSFPKTLHEEWIWEKDKLVQINTMDFEYLFIYDKNSYLIEVSSDIAKIVFEYKDKMLHKMKVLHENAEVMSLEVTKVAGKKITQLRESHFDWKSSTIPKELAQMLSAVSRCCFSEAINDGINTSIAYGLNHVKTTKSLAYTIMWDLSYINDNVTTIKKSFDDGYSTSYNYQYDSKLNPFFRYYIQDASEGTLFGMIPFSKNNVITADEEGNLSHYEYEYDGNFPVIQRRVETNTDFEYEYIQNPITGEWLINGTTEIEQKIIAKFYFEYLK
ncbi:MAG: hypothetical protein LBU51_02770 [Bacteroidales bacterium]|jgi:hypothetical protein|nr:hypothetical protein [Bacteroidales bacterium]